MIMEIKYYELECGVKAKEDEEYGCEICRGLFDLSEYEDMFVKAEECNYEDETIGII